MTSLSRPLCRLGSVGILLYGDQLKYSLTLEPPVPHIFFFFVQTYSILQSKQIQKCNTRFLLPHIFGFSFFISK